MDPFTSSFDINTKEHRPSVHVESQDKKNRLSITGDGENLSLIELSLPFGLAIAVPIDIKYMIEAINAIKNIPKQYRTEQRHAALKTVGHVISELPRGSKSRSKNGSKSRSRSKKGVNFSIDPRHSAVGKKILDYAGY